MASPVTKNPIQESRIAAGDTFVCSESETDIFLVTAAGRESFPKSIALRLVGGETRRNESVGQAFARVWQEAQQYGLPPLRALQSLQGTRKLLALPDEPRIPACTPLTKQELLTFLRDFPDLIQRDVAQGRLKALAYILSVHEEGIPTRIQSPLANRELMDQIRYIMQYIVRLTPPDAREHLLKQLIFGLEGCAIQTQCRVAQLCTKLLGGGDFEQQMHTFTFLQKEQAVDRTLARLYPAFAQAEVCQCSYDRSSEQQPHVKSGFVQTYGGQIGFATRGAQTDPNANRYLAMRDEAKFFEIFFQEFSPQTLVKEFVRQVNGSEEGAAKSGIDNLTFLTWCGRLGWGFEAMYGADKHYQAYSPKPEARHTGHMAAYIHEALAIRVFCQLRYVD